MKGSEPSYLVVGHLNRAHGTKGEVFVWPLTDHPGSTFVPGVELFLAGGDGQQPEGALPPLRIETVRAYRRGFLVRFEGVEDRSAAEDFQGRYLLRPRDDLPPLEEGEVFYHQLLGLRVRTVGGREVGEIVEVYELRPADLLEVRGAEGVHYVPFLESIVRRLDVEEGILEIEPPEGLLDL